MGNQRKHPSQNSKRGLGAETLKKTPQPEKTDNQYPDIKAKTACLVVLRAETLEVWKSRALLGFFVLFAVLVLGTYFERGKHATKTKELKKMETTNKAQRQDTREYFAFNFQTLGDEDKLIPVRRSSRIRNLIQRKEDTEIAHDVLNIADILQKRRIRWSHAEEQALITPGTKVLLRSLFRRCLHLGWVSAKQYLPGGGLPSSTSGVK